MTERNTLIVKDAQEARMLVLKLDLSQRNLYFDPVLNFAILHLFCLIIQYGGNSMYTKFLILNLFPDLRVVLEPALYF